MFLLDTPAQVAKLVDALALGASEATHEGSSPFLGTKTLRKSNLLLIFSFCVAELYFCLNE